VLIGQVASQAGVSTKTLRFWEREGLVEPPPRTAGGYRDYAPAVVERLRFITAAQSAGFTLAQIGQILAVRDAGSAPCGHVAELVAQRLADIEARVAELTAVRASLLSVSDRLDSLDPTDCDSTCVVCPAITR
jgi:DNA-binding transcriptional MerR regulator